MPPLHTVGAIHSDRDKDNGKRKKYLELQNPLPTILLLPPALLGERDCNEQHDTMPVFCSVSSSLKTQAPPPNSHLLLLFKFWTIYAILHLRALERQHSSWGMDVTERFIPPLKKSSLFWHTGKCTARECWRARCHPSLTSVCFHLSTTVLIDKTSFPDVITSRAHMLTSLRHHCWLPA